MSALIPPSFSSSCSSKHEVDWLNPAGQLPCSLISVCFPPGAVGTADLVLLGKPAGVYSFLERGYNVRSSLGPNGDGVSH